jgi:hypothetical protein
MFRQIAAVLIGREKGFIGDKNSGDISALAQERRVGQSRTRQRSDLAVFR